MELQSIINYTNRFILGDIYFKTQITRKKSNWRFNNKKKGSASRTQSGSKRKEHFFSPKKNVSPGYIDSRFVARGIGKSGDGEGCPVLLSTQRHLFSYQSVYAGSGCLCYGTASNYWTQAIDFQIRLLLASSWHNTFEAGPLLFNRRAASDKLLLLRKTARAKYHFCDPSGAIRLINAMAFQSWSLNGSVLIFKKYHHHV